MKLIALRILFVFSTALIMAAGLQAFAQESVPIAPDTVPASNAPTETYRLRVENALYGRIEVSLDGGERYLLLGRVRQPAFVTVPDKTALKPGVVLRSSGEGLAIAVGVGQALKILPMELNRRTLTGKTTAGAILTDAEPRKGFFNDLLSPVGSLVQLQLSPRVLRPFSEGYAPASDDVFVFPVTLAYPAPKDETAPKPDDPRYIAWLDGIKKRWEAVAQEYAEQSMARARASKRTVVSGMLTLRAKLPAGEPEPITAVEYSIDGDIVASQTTFPSMFGWDTRRVPNGEHVIEIRALSKYHSIITKVRALVVVQNTQP